MCAISWCLGYAQPLYDSFACWVSQFTMEFGWKGVNIPWPAVDKWRPIPIKVRVMGLNAISWQAHLISVLCRAQLSQLHESSRPSPTELICFLQCYAWFGTLLFPVVPSSTIDFPTVVYISALKPWVWLQIWIFALNSVQSCLSKHFAPK